MNNSNRNYDFWVNIVIAFSLGLAASFLYTLISNFKVEILSLSLLNLVLATLLVFTLNIIKSLSFKASRFNNQNKKEIQKILIGEVLNSLTSYGYIKNKDKEEEVRETLASAVYVRGQNIYYMMHHGIITVKSKVLFVNDHPFKPFSDLINLNIPQGANYMGVGAIPDELYPKEDILRRIKIIEDHNMEYYFLPDKDVHLSMVIFDDNAAILYSTPENRNVCNFSEGLLFTDKKALKEITKSFDYIFNMAKKRYKGDMKNVINELRNISTFYLGPNS